MAERKSIRRGLAPSPDRRVDCWARGRYSDGSEYVIPVWSGPAGQAMAKCRLIERCYRLDLELLSTGLIKRSLVDG